MYSFDLAIRDYNLWRAEVVPVVLVLFDAVARRAFWLLIQRYFQEDPSRRPRMGAKTVRVHVSQRQAVNRRATRQIRIAKEEMMGRLPGGV